MVTICEPEASAVPEIGPCVYCDAAPEEESGFCAPCLNVFLQRQRDEEHTRRENDTSAQIVWPARTAREPISPTVRFDVFRRDGFRCTICGLAATDVGVILEIDHIRPVRLGGRNEVTNLRTTCRECNRGKGGRL